MPETLSHGEQMVPSLNRKVEISAHTLEMVLQMNGCGMSLTADLIENIRRALGENPNEPN